MIQAKQLAIPKGYYAHTNEQVNVTNGKASIRKVPDAPLFNNTIDLRIDKKLGGLAFVEGATFPRKGYPDEGSVYAINIIKSLLNESLKHPALFIRKEASLKSFNTLCSKILGNYKVSALCPTARAISSICSTFLIELGVKKETATETGYYVAHVFEYDDVWRYIMQDMATSCHAQNIGRREIKRLMGIFSSRSLPGISRKMERFLKPFLIALYLPSVKRGLKKASIYIKEMVYDEADYYWASMKYGYDFGGQSYEQRTKNIKIPTLYTVDNNTPLPTGNDILEALEIIKPNK